MTVAAVAMGSAVATAMLGVMLDVGDRVNHELRSLGANLLVTPKAASLPVEIGGISYQPVSPANFIPEEAVPKIKSIFWSLNIVGFAPSLHANTRIKGPAVELTAPVEGVWFRRRVASPGGIVTPAGLRNFASTWKVEGAWIDDADPNARAAECMLGASLARRLKILAPGGAVEMYGMPFRVTGILDTGGDEGDRAFVRSEVLQRLVNRPGQIDAVQVGALTKPEDDFARRDIEKMTPAEYDRWYCTPYIRSIAHQIEEALPSTAAKPVWRVADSEGKVLGKVSGLMFLVALAALLSAGLTVWSVMTTMVLERRQEIAIMQAIGGGGWLIAALFAFEVALEGAVGGVIGSLAGAALIEWVGRSVFDSGGGIAPLLGPLVVAVAVLVALGGAAHPIGRALSMEPARVLRGEA